MSHIILTSFIVLHALANSVESLTLGNSELYITIKQKFMINGENT